MRASSRSGMPAPSDAVRRLQETGAGIAESGRTKRACLVLVCAASLACSAPPTGGEGDARVTEIREFMEEYYGVVAREADGVWSLLPTFSGIPDLYTIACDPDNPRVQNSFEANFVEQLLEQANPDAGPAAVTRDALEVAQGEFLSLFPESGSPDLRTIRDLERRAQVRYRREIVESGLLDRFIFMDAWRKNVANPSPEFVERKAWLRKPEPLPGIENIDCESWEHVLTVCTSSASDVLGHIRPPGCEGRVATPCLRAQVRHPP